MARILVLCPSHRDRRELPAVAARAGHELVWHEYASAQLEEMLSPRPPAHAPGDILREIEHIVAAHGGRVDAVASTDDYPGSSLASVVARRLGLPGTDPKANLLCQHKYHSRLLQLRAGVEGTPECELLADGCAPTLALPCFVKPVKSFFSIGAGVIVRREDAERRLRAARLPPAFLEPFRRLFEAHAGTPFGEGSVVAERLLAGEQATLHGYAWQGELHTLGVVDSVMHEGTSVFRRFEHPSRLPASALRRMEAVTQAALRALGFDHGLFNVELFHDPVRDAVHVIEINPRMASQFADLHEKVDGTNTYEILLDLALGRRPSPRSRAGAFAFAASEVLRRFTDAEVLDVPSEQDVREAAFRHPGARIEVLATPGRRLSDELQDGRSFRYAVINVGAASREQAIAEAAHIAGSLRFGFRDLPCAAPAAPKRATATRDRATPSAGGRPG